MAVAELPVHDPELPVVFWLSVGKLVQLDKLPEDGVFKGLLLVSADEVVAVAELPVHDPELPVVF